MEIRLGLLASELGLNSENSILWLKYTLVVYKGCLIINSGILAFETVLRVILVLSCTSGLKTSESTKSKYNQSNYNYVKLYYDKV